MLVLVSICLGKNYLWKNMKQQWGKSRWSLRHFYRGILSPLWALITEGFSFTSTPLSSAPPGSQSYFSVLILPNVSFWFCVVSTFLFIDWTNSGDLHAPLPCSPWLYPTDSISDFWGCPLRTDSLYPKQIHHLLYHSGPNFLELVCLHL